MEITENRIEEAARLICAHMHDGIYSGGFDRVNPTLRQRCLRAAEAVLSDVTKGLI